MNKLLFTIVLSLFSICINTSAQSKSNLPAVSMVSYEQRWLDSEGTIALKNNTSEEIHNISFELEYLDMQGNPMDYENFTYRIDIAPGMTKKLDIPAYEHSRNYHYYKTKDAFGHPAFKLRYKLKDYNNSAAFMPSDNIIFDEATQYDSDNQSGILAISTILILLFCLGIYVGMYVLVAVMAQQRGRNPVIWLLLSFIATPLLICIILLALGREHKNEY